MSDDPDWFVMEIESENEAWSLGEDRYHLMLARGEAPGGRIKHHQVKVGGELILTD